MSTVTNALVIAVLIYGAVVLAAYLGQRKLLYIPDRSRLPPAALGLSGVEERTLTTPDGERILTWQAAPRPGMPTILYFHGNAGNLASRAERVRSFVREGWGVLMMAYRGYAGSSGSPSETANVADARLAYEHLIAAGVPAEMIVVYGESLGSGVAIQLAAERKVRAVILDAPYTSIVDVAAQVYPFLPVRPLLSDRYESDRHVARVAAPILVLHGERDRTIPVAMGRAMFGLAPGEKRLVTFPKAGHSDLYQHGALEAIRGWLSELEIVPAR